MIHDEVENYQRPCIIILELKKFLSFSFAIADAVADLFW